MKCATTCAETPNTQRTMTRYFRRESSAGFDEAFRKQIEAEVAQFSLRAEADVMAEREKGPADPLGLAIDIAELEAAQSRLRQGSRHGGDLVPNSALRTKVSSWQLLILAMLNAVMSLHAYAEQWRRVQLAPLIKSGQKRVRECMDDFRPIGLLACVAKLWEQVLLPRFLLKLSPHLGTDQEGGFLGADACELYLRELLALRRAGRCPDAKGSTASTWLAFLDI